VCCYRMVNDGFVKGAGGQVFRSEERKTVWNVFNYIIIMNTIGLGF
jgi:hypothetical protein